ncbi:MAG: hypothetical protein A2010_11930 [Nitrospirae bacterium GWD2_57_9]|nr:MAG: hypothetical protein A2010_11930 [Nitrospirae bacterium GWD2_57_9]OGW45189.1 MAG: hypothetical protein A2078_06370 [Nitrospirae bacterium GWC2_57_9]
MKNLRLLTALLLLALLPGCLYVHTLQPLTVNMDRTPLSQAEKQGTVKTISLPYMGQTHLAAWGNAAIGQVAKEQDMKEVYFADLEIFSVLRIWNEYTVHVYGK